MQSFVSIDYFVTKEGLLFLFSRSLDISSFSKFPTFQQILYKYFCEAEKENCLSSFPHSHFSSRRWWTASFSVPAKLVSAEFDTLSFDLADRSIEQ
jgi:hypothetical protein